MPNPEDIELGNIGGNPPEEETEDSNTAGTPQPSESGDSLPVEVPLLALPEDTNLPAVAEPGAAAPQRNAFMDTCGRAVRSVMRYMLLALSILFFEEYGRFIVSQVESPHNCTTELLGSVCDTYYRSGNQIAKAGCASLFFCLFSLCIFFPLALLITFFSGGFGHLCVNFIAPPHHSRRWVWAPPLYSEEPPPPRAYWEEPPTGSPPPYPGDVQSHWEELPPYSEEPSSGSPLPESSTQAEDSEGGITSHPNQDGGTPPRLHLCNQPVMTSQPKTTNTKKPVYRTLLTSYLICLIQKT